MAREQFYFENPVSPMQETLEDGTIVTRTSAWSPPGCHSVGCGIKLFVKDGELVKVEGDPENPLTRGRLCPRCLALKEYIYHPDRIIYPMKRAKEDRGLDKWERISWDEATEIIVRETNRIKEQWGPQSIIVYSGTGREAVRYSYPLASQVLGTPNHAYCQSGWSCVAPRGMSMSSMFGTGYIEFDFGGCLPKMWDDPDYVPPKYVLMIGKEPLKSNPDGLWGHSLVEVMKKHGTKLITIDPRVTWIGSKAEHHLQLRPNTDAALLLALINIICTEDLVDHDFIDKWCYGFNELAERAKEYTPEFAAEECGVPVEEIYAVARILGTQKPWSILIGVACDQNPNSCQVTQAVFALAAITGNIDIPGGAIPGYSYTVDINNDSPLDPELENMCIGWDQYPALKMLVNTPHPDLVLEALETDKPYPIKMAWFDSSNLLSPTCSAQPKRWHDALQKMEFVVAKETFMNPTTMAVADIILPLSTWAEHNGLVMNNQGCQMGTIGAINKALTVGECKSDLEMYCWFGQAFHGENWKGAKTAEEWLDQDLKGMGLSWEEMSNQVVGINTIYGYHKHEKGVNRFDGKPGFMTNTGRIELYTTRFQQMGDDPLPYYIAPPLCARQHPEYADAYPYTLITGPRHYASFHSEHRQIPSLRALNPNPLAELHPDVAGPLGISTGDDIILENPWGKGWFKAVVTPAIRPDTISADHGWWFPEEDGEEPNLFGVWKSNVNMFLPHKIIGKMGYGAPYKAMPVTVHKA